MIVIGIDPGTATTGYGVVESKKEDLWCLECGVIETSKKLSPSKRLSILNEELSLIIRKYHPKLIAVESIYFFKNLKTALPVSQAKGVIMMTAEKEKVPIYDFTPLQIKMAITGYGRADKKQMQGMIKIILRLEKTPRPDDVADALGAAICGMQELVHPFKPSLPNL